MNFKKIADTSFKHWIVNEIGSKNNCRSYKNQGRRTKNNYVF